MPGYTSIDPRIQHIVNSACQKIENLLDTLPKESPPIKLTIVGNEENQSLYSVTLGGKEKDLSTLKAKLQFVLQNEKVTLKFSTDTTVSKELKQQFKETLKTIRPPNSLGYKNNITFDKELHTSQQTAQTYQARK